LIFTHYHIKTQNPDITHYYCPVDVMMYPVASVEMEIRKGEHLYCGSRSIGQAGVAGDSCSRYKGIVEGKREGPHGCDSWSSLQVEVEPG